ncbi:MAG: ATP-binding protein [Candidatus Pacebacteria bacterium]|nr:ATP-binding protein [Candidatus Paceibacterota bacterium]MBT3511494.1 ATP-binding protein [Candidatus Paceibacterota bacterium]MBT4004654.1 ATP-binding protein [Candidatus Paceibacterota bacterium]MBT4358428.1 ATP-binding protein [Candidatus Paceibacterota bacterium]MBT4681048.1 ATP-binding protein [Candidatus Paceibacterota bacterium]
MFKRNIEFPKNTSFFLFGPRGTGKSSLIKRNYPDSTYIDLLNSSNYTKLLAQPHKLSEFLTKSSDIPVVIDEVQRIPDLLNEVHHLIENQGFKFILTGSNARKLRTTQANLLAGRAFKYNLHPLTFGEIGSNVDLQKVLKFGLLPTIHDRNKNIDAQKYLESYIQIYLEEEILQEGLTRNLSNFARFLEVASFSQAQQLNVSAVARDSAVSRKVAESYFQILYDLLIAYELPVFKKHAKRSLVSQNKFYFFDIGVYSTIKPKGLLDKKQSEEGTLLESLVLQELLATNSNLNLQYDINYWRTPKGTEVDFILYGKSRLLAIEVKRKTNITSKDLRGLRAFKSDYPMSELFVFYGGDKELNIDGIKVIPIKKALLNLPEILKEDHNN